MVQSHSAEIVGLGDVDPLLSRIRIEAEEVLRQEPELAGFVLSNILNHPTVESVKNAQYKLV